MVMRSFKTSFAQQRLYFLQQLEPWNPAYTIVETFQLRGEVNRGALATALRRVTERHEMLRCRFITTDGLPELVISKQPCRALLRIIDFSSYRLDRARHRAFARLQATAATPLNLSLGPLFYAELILLPQSESLLSLCMHHIISDGWSVKVICDEVSEIYNAARSGRPPSLADLPIDYVDFAEWEQTGARGELMTRQRDYWLRQLDGAPVVLDLPPGDANSHAGQFLASSSGFTISRQLTTALRQRAAESRITLFAFLFAAFQAALASWTGQRDFLVGVPASGRGRLELHHVVGLFVNMLAIRSSLWDDPAFDVLAERVGAACVGAFEHQDFPFQQLVELVNPARDSLANPLVQASFQLIDAMLDCRLDLAGADARRADPIVVRTPFDLEVDVVEHDETLDCRIYSSNAGISPHTVASLRRLYETVLIAALADPGRRASELGSAAH